MGVGNSRPSWLSEGFENDLAGGSSRLDIAVRGGDLRQRIGMDGELELTLFVHGTQSGGGAHRKLYMRWHEIAADVEASHGLIGVHHSRGIDADGFGRDISVSDDGA